MPRGSRQSDQVVQAGEHGPSEPQLRGRAYEAEAPESKLQRRAHSQTSSAKASDRKASSQAYSKALPVQSPKRHLHRQPNIHSSRAKDCSGLRKRRPPTPKSVATKTQLIFRARCADQRRTCFCYSWNVVETYLKHSALLYFKK